MEKRLHVDLRTSSYEDFVDFVFNHVPEDEVNDKWYWQVRLDVAVDPRVVIGYLTRLCKEPTPLLMRFTVRQFTEGVNFLFGAGGGKWFRDQLWNSDVPWIERRECILAIPELYTHIFEDHDDGGLGFMLWDEIAYGYTSGSRAPEANPEDARVQQAMFEALTAMLRSENPDTLAGAVHGLGHLRHPDSNRAIRALLASDRALDPELRSYAAEVLEEHFQ